MRPFDARLVRAVPEVRAPLATLAALGVLSGAATVGTAFALAGLVVAVVTGRPLPGPAWWLAALFVARALLAAAGDVVAAWAGVSVSTRLRWALLRRWGDLDADERPERSTAVTLATAGTSAVEPYAARFLPALATGAVVPVLALAALAVVDWPSAVVVVLTVPLLPLFAALIGRATAESTAARWAALAALSGHFLDVVRGLPTLVAYGRAERQVETVRDVSARHRRATMGTLRLAFLSSAALELLATICVAIVAVLVGVRLAGGSMALGPALTAILLAPEAYWPIRRVGAEFHAAADGAAALDGILAALTREPMAGPSVGGQAGSASPVASTLVPSPAPSPVPSVAARGLRYRHPGSDADVLAGLDLAAGPGLTAITGPSGVGKSTLLELLARVRTPTGGVLRAPGAHLVTQRPFLAAGTVREALTISRAAPDEALWEALRRVRLDGVVAGMDGGLGGRLGDDGFGLSAGQRQRLALARAWLSVEPLLLLDEPTAHLDGPAADAAHELIAELAERRTVVAVTHRPELLHLAAAHVRLSRPTDVHLLPPRTATEVPA
ncbi:MAG TPA: thiol reductant ABC exporter subunit CydD [Intrasporangium sp.]|uniref:thiol reductant ABC exporter subunit CydD n=1 Tax=Intrasporangium sp. TaxID=1925024 RepID=UPI002D798D2F|nr:thiol reductant ABC exporter subunit CydD [Intrasporangium sp.]HET7399765.1 thiol reductant ABC exporter subunit CydD [Intrasporangium sp.]